jgi:hypothetical protein
MPIGVGNKRQKAHLWLILDLHVGGGEDLGVDSLWESGVDLLPGRPDRHSEGERSSDGEDGVPNDVPDEEKERKNSSAWKSSRFKRKREGTADLPEESVKEEEAEVHDEHDGEGEGGMVLAEGGSEVPVRAVLDSHPDHGSDGVLEREREEEVRLGELASEDKDPEHDRGDPRGRLELGVRGREGLVGEVLSALASDSVTKHSAGREHSKEDGGANGDEELDDTDDEGDLGRRVEAGDVDSRTGGKGEDDEEEDESTSKVGSVVPGGGDVRELGKSGRDHDGGRDGSSEGANGPGHRSLRVCRAGGGIDGGRVVGGVVPEEGDVADPDSVEVDEEMEEGSLLEVRLEERTRPVDLVELHEPTGGSDVDEAGLEVMDGE